MATKALDGSTIAAPCMGGCGGVITYTITLEHGSPEISPPLDAVAFAGGHLCSTCEHLARQAWAKAGKTDTAGKRFVHVTAYHHRHGDSAVAFYDRGDALSNAAALIDDSLHEVSSTSIRQIVTRLITSEKIDEAIDLYNHSHPDDSIEILDVELTS